MRKMKDSGVEWIGDIPADWKINKIGSVYEERSVKVSDKDYAPLSVTKQGIVPQLESAAKTDNGDNRKLIRKNDFVINSRSDRRGSCGISAYDGSCSLINTVLKPKRNMCNLYYSFVFRSESFADEFYKWGHGIVDDLWSTKWSDMKKIYIPSPDLEEQQKISAYLDRKCTDIDYIISALKKQTETLEEYKKSLITETVTKGLNPDVKMKDSGVEWIGEIPAHWNISKIKYNVDFEPSCSKAGLTEKSVITYTPMEFIKNGFFINNTAVLGNVSSSLTPYQEGDIVMAKVTPCFENGNISVMENLSSGYGLGSSELFVFRPFNMITKYLLYWLQNHFFKERACSTMTGMGGLKRVSSNFVKNCYVHFPPIEEQKAIAEYLDRKCTQIDGIISGKKQQIKSMEEYKKSLIFEYVTGKQEVK